MSERKQNALNEFKLKLLAPAQENATVRFDRKQEPTMALSVVDNQPKLTVYTNVEGDKNSGRIEAVMDSFTFYAVLEAIRSVASDKEAETIPFQNLGYFFGAEGRSKEPMTLSTTMVGRNSKGMVYIALVAKNRPAIQFVFSPGNMTKLVSTDGKPVDDTKSSELYARAYCNLMEKLVAEILQDEFISWQDIKARKEANKRGGGGGYGGGNQGGNGGGGYSKPAAPAEQPDKDIMW